MNHPIGQGGLFGGRKAAVSLSFLAMLIVATIIVPALPAQAATNHIWPVCTSKTMERGWGYTTFRGHNPSDWDVDINWGGGDDDRGRWVVASAAGTIVGKRDYGVSSYGKTITLKHADGTMSFYAHLGWSTSLGIDNSVVQGQLIGTIGYKWHNGAAQYHLHYEQRLANGSPKEVYINGSRVYYFTGADVKRTFYPTHVRPSCP